MEWAVVVLSVAVTALAVCTAVLSASIPFLFHKLLRLERFTLLRLGYKLNKIEKDLADVDSVLASHLEATYGKPKPEDTTTADQSSAGGNY